METSLDLLCPGTRAVITHMDTSPELERRLRDFGVVPGTAVCCRYRNPWGDLAALQLRGTVLALRTDDLRGVRAEMP